MEAHPSDNVRVGNPSACDISVTAEVLEDAGIYWKQLLKLIKWKYYAWNIALNDKEEMTFYIENFMKVSAGNGQNLSTTH
jgi:hypothetical protein